MWSSCQVKCKIRKDDWLSIALEACLFKKIVLKLKTSYQSSNFLFQNFIRIIQGLKAPSKGRFRGAPSFTVAP